MVTRLADSLRIIKLIAWGRVMERAMQQYPKEMEFRGVMAIALNVAHEIVQESGGAISTYWISTFLEKQVEAMWDHVEAKLQQSTASGEDDPR